MVRMIRAAGIGTAIVFATVVAMTLASVPALAQMDFAGEWRPVPGEDSTGNPIIGDYFGIPVNEAGILRADTYDALILDLVEWQCRPHPVDYMPRGPSAFRIWKNVDPVSREIVSWDIDWFRAEDVRSFYMDGRGHPPEWDRHTWGGFSTAEWEGGTLKITTTHLKEGYFRRNGMARSDLATVTNRLIRRRFDNQDYLTWITIVYDPVYLAEPSLRATEHSLNPNQMLLTYPCDPRQEILQKPRSWVPHHLPGANPDANEAIEAFRLPEDVARGGPETIYPEYRQNFETGPSN